MWNSIIKSRTPCPVIVPDYSEAQPTANGTSMGAKPETEARKTVILVQFSIHVLPLGFHARRFLSRKTAIRSRAWYKESDQKCRITAVLFQPGFEGRLRSLQVTGFPENVPPKACIDETTFLRQHFCNRNIQMPLREESGLGLMRPMMIEMGLRQQRMVEAIFPCYADDVPRPIPILGTRRGTPFDPYFLAAAPMDVSVGAASGLRSSSVVGISSATVG
jgi:hypothetical protein